MTAYSLAQIDVKDPESYRRDAAPRPGVVA